MTKLSKKMLEVLTCLYDWEDAHYTLQQEEDENTRMLEKLDLNLEQNGDFEIDDDD